MVTFTAVMYGLAMSAIGWFFGRKDAEDIPIYDIGLRSHLATYLIFMSISLVWFWEGYHSSLENIRTLYITGLIWGCFLVAHLLVYFLVIRRKSIDGLDKNNLFE